VIKSMHRCTAGLMLAALLLTGCASTPGYDYSAFREARPRSILVLPPLNASSSVDATYGVYSQVTLPLAESGYYVFPVTLVDETFKQNGLSNPADIRDVPIAKLHEIFGADAALYIDVQKYGTSYQIIGSESRVTASARLIDLRSGNLLWKGEATASSAENQGGQSSLIGALVQALVTQIVESTTDHSHEVAGITAARLLSAGQPGGILYGPRSPKYDTQ